MKQILQNLNTGETYLEDVPVPIASQGMVLVRTEVSLISLGTEKMLIEFGQGSLLAKAKQQPDRVKQVLNKVKTDGLAATVKTVKAKLDTPLPLGYCNVGTVVEVGPGVSGIKIGDRVATNGNHAEYVCVPENLCARVGDTVSSEEASFTVIGAIALQGLRLANPTLGETFVVFGLGLVGLITVQLLKANGCNVIGVDIDESKIELARSFGATGMTAASLTEPLSAGAGYNDGSGVDGVIITAATKSNEPMHQAAQMCRKRGRVVLVGVTGLDLQRSDFYEKEISFQVSCSYGPGRYESNYEDKGMDYPIGFVRWTENRNFRAVLNLIENGNLDVSELITHRFKIGQAVEAYQKIMADRTTLGALLSYPGPDEKGESSHSVVLSDKGNRFDSAHPVVGVIGAGNFTAQFTLPALKETDAELNTLVSQNGVSSTHLGRKYGFIKSATDSEAVINNQDVNTVFITTRHDSHADLVKRALKARKRIFVEKPLVINEKQFIDLENELKDADSPFLMVGFNRRFAPLIRPIKEQLEKSAQPASIIYTVNAGNIPADHWVHDPQVGGGRIVGEVCHFIDLLRYLADSPIEKIISVKAAQPGLDEVTSDILTISLGFANGSFGTIHYLANGHSSFPKERLEVFSSGRILQLDNFLKLRSYGWTGVKSRSRRIQDKGHKACVASFIEAVAKGSEPPISINEILEVTRASLDIAGLLKY